MAETNQIKQETDQITMIKSVCFFYFYITLIFFLRAVVSAISAFLTLETHCAHIYHISITCYCAVCVSE